MDFIVNCYDANGKLLDNQDKLTGPVAVELKKLLQDIVGKRSRKSEPEFSKISEKQD
jgi:hypothetical protein